MTRPSALRVYWLPEIVASNFIDFLLYVQLASYRPPKEPLSIWHRMQTTKQTQTTESR